MAKIQSLQDVNGNIIYPKSVASAIHYDNEHTVGELISDSVYIDTNNDNNIDIDNPIDATTLNGHNSDYYAKKK